MYSTPKTLLKRENAETRKSLLLPQFQLFFALFAKRYCPDPVTFSYLRARARRVSAATAFECPPSGVLGLAPGDLPMGPTPARARSAAGQDRQEH